MSYKISKNQTGIEKGLTRYDFDFSFNNKRSPQKRVLCAKRDVEIEYINYVVQNNPDLFENLVSPLQKEAPGSHHRFFENFEIYINHYLHGRCKGDCKNNEYIIRKRQQKLFFNFFGDIPLEEFSPVLIERYIILRQTDGIKPASINRELAVLSHFFNFCIKDRKLTYNPAKGTKLKEDNIRYVRLSPGQVQEIIDKSSGELKVVVILALFAGLRRNEILTLKWSDIDFNNNLILLKSSNVKGKKKRDPIRVPDFLIAELNLFRKQNHFSEKVFTLTKASLRGLWDRLVMKLSFDVYDYQTGEKLKLHFHDTRHAYAVNLLEKGISIDVIRTQLGHHDSAFSQRRYANVSPLANQDDINRLAEILTLKKSVN